MDVRLEDGRVIKNVPEGTTKAELLARLEKAGSGVEEAPAQEEGSYARGVAQSAAQGVLFGGADEAQAAFGAFLDKHFGPENPLANDPTIAQAQKSNFESLRGIYDQERRDFQEANPLVGYGAEIGGALLTGGLSARLAQKAGATGLAMWTAPAAVDGAVYGYLEKDAELDNVLERGKQAVIGGLIGAGGGAALYGAGKGVQKAIQMKKGKPPTEFDEANDLLDQFEDEYTVLLASQPEGGADGMRLAHDRALRELGLDDAQFAKVIDDAKRTPNYPAPETAKRNAPDIVSARRAAADGARAAANKNGFVAKLAETGQDAIDAGSSRLKTVSQPIARRARQYEHDLKRRQQQVVEPLHELKKLHRYMSASAYKTFSKALNNGDRVLAKQMIPEGARGANKSMRELLDDAYKALDDIGAEQKKLGYEWGHGSDYWPRRVMDLEGYRNALGRDVRDKLDDHLKTMAAKKGKRFNKQQEINKFMLEQDNAARIGGKPGFAQERTIGHVSDDMIQYYDDPIKAMTKYAHTAIDDIEMKKFFDKSAAGGSLKRLQNTRAFVDAIDGEDIQMIENAIADLVINEGISGKAADELRKVLSARFGKGRQGSGWLATKFKEMSTLTGIGQVQSTIIQLGDLANAAYKNGIRNTMRAAVRAAGEGTVAKSNLALQDVGLNNVLAVDLIMDETKLSKLTDGVLTATGFKKFDRFAKRTIIEGARIKNQKLLQSGKGQQRFKEKWGQFYGDDTDALMTALKNNDSENPLYLEHMFNEVSDIQPVSMLEMPTAYMNSPELRVLYTLKSYMLKQLNIVREDVIREAKNGNPGRATRNALVLMGLVGGMNGTVEEMRDVTEYMFDPSIASENFHAEDIPHNMAETFMSIIFMNRYARDQVAKDGNLISYLSGVVSPAFPAMPTSAENAPDRLLGMVPIVGRNLKAAFGDEGKRRDRLKKERKARRLREKGPIPYLIERR
jgi:hypothetical protein